MTSDEPSGAPAAPQDVGVAVTPPSASIAPTGQQLFAATVTGTANASVTWQIASSGCGSITAGGLYTAPSTAATCQVLAVSNANSSKSAAALISVQNPGPPPASGDTKWEALKIGAGGWLVGMDVDPLGSTYLVRTDTYGAYVSDGSSPWRQLITSASMPAADLATFGTQDTPWFPQGVYEIRVAPSNPNRLYMIFIGSGYLSQTVYRSDDRGTSWYRAGNGYLAGSLDPNDSYRQNGEKLAVDPVNPDVAYAGAAGGLYVTTNGGGSWSLVSGVPAPTTAAEAITGIVFDPTTGKAGGQTTTIYATSNGNGVYRSTDAGVTWSAMPSGGPTTCAHAVVASDGTLYMIAADTSSNLLYRFTGGAWATSAINPSGANGDTRGLAVDPFNSARVVCSRGSGHLSVSTNHGVTFSGWNWTQTLSATDVPWLQSQNVGPGTSMAVAAIRFDPVTQNKLWFSEGTGVWTVTNPSATTPNAWQSFSAGIEQLVAYDVTVPPGSAYVFVAGGDKSVFRTLRNNTAYPTSDVTMGHTDPLIPAWAVNYSWVNPQHVVAVINGISYGTNPGYSGYSLDGGATWTQFPSQPAAGFGGDVIAPSIDNILMVVGSNGYAYRSTNRGTSWTALAGVPGGLHAGGFSVQKHVLAIDGAYDGSTNKTLYLYAAGNGTYRSTDDGATWTRVSTKTLTGDTYGVKLRSVPGQAGHLFLTVGRTGSPGSPHPWSGTYLYRSTDGGVTWATVPGVGEPYDVALGAPAPSGSYPAIYFAGWYNSVWGIWRSVDSAATWQQIGPYPNNSLDMINTLAAARDTYGELYVAFQGSGWAKGSLK
jgi:photosystem II stability/assembly factor-like uncharacterized protein